MYSVWTKHLKDDREKEEFEKSVYGSRRVLKRLKDLCEESEEDLDGYETNTKNYDNPNWAYRQADNNGFRRCLKMINKLIDLDQQQFPADHKETK